MQLQPEAGRGGEGRGEERGGEGREDIMHNTQLYVLHCTLLCP